MKLEIKIYRFLYMKKIDNHRKESKYIDLMFFISINFLFEIIF